MNIHGMGGATPLSLLCECREEPERTVSYQLPLVQFIVPVTVEAPKRRKHIKPTEKPGT